MKKRMCCWLFSLVFLSTSYAQYTERTGYEGDFFSLEGALDLFKQSTTLRDFERQINTRENWVNNLDLNYDGQIDYIRVTHRQEGAYHAIILQALVDRYAIQDVAVIEIEVIGRGEAILQIVGDEDLYGEEVFVEPIEGYSNSRSGYHPEYGNYVNVYYWTPVQYILGRQYQPYVSPYRWRSYPVWWNPWVPCTWNVFRPRIVIYFRYYHVVPRPRLIRVHRFYRPYRSYCQVVVQRANRVRIKQGRAPVYRPAPVRQRGWRSGQIQAEQNVEERRGLPTRPDAPRQRTSVNEKRTQTFTDRADGRRNSTSRANQESRRSANRKGTTHSTIRSGTPRQNPSLDRKRTPSSPDRGSIKSRTPGTTEKYRSSASGVRSSRTTTPPSAPRQRPSVSRKPQPSYDQNRSTPSRVERPARSAPNRSRTTTRSAGSQNKVFSPRTSRRSASPGSYQPSQNKTTRPVATTPRKPSVNTRRTAPASRSKANRSSNSKRSKRSDGAKSRRGRGN